MCIIFSRISKNVKPIGKRKYLKILPSEPDSYSLLHQDHSGIRWNVGRMLHQQLQHSSIRFFYFIFCNSLSLIAFSLVFTFFSTDVHTGGYLGCMSGSWRNPEAAPNFCQQTSQTTHKVTPLWKEKKCHQHFVFYFILFFRFPLLLRTKNIQIIPQKIWWYIFYNTGRILSSFHN